MRPTAAQRTLPPLTLTLTACAALAAALAAALPASRLAADAPPAGRGDGADRATGRQGRVAGGADDELAAVQGRWEREEAEEGGRPYRRVVKQIKGDCETITHLDKDGNVVHRHKVQFELGRGGPVKTFTFRNLQVTDGPNKGEKTAGPVSYVYRVDDEHFVEVWGLLPGQENRPVQMWEWTRARPAGRQPRARAVRPAAPDRAAAGFAGRR